MIISDYHAVLHPGKKWTKPKHLSLSLLPSPSLPPPQHFQTRKKKKEVILWWILELAPTFMLVALTSNRKFIYNSQKYFYALAPKSSASENSFGKKVPSGVMWAASRRCRNVHHSTAVFIFISVCGIFVFIHCIFIMICFLIQDTFIFD